MVGEVGVTVAEDALVVGADVGGLGEVTGQGANTKTRGKEKQNTPNQREKQLNIARLSHVSNGCNRWQQQERQTQGHFRGKLD